MTLTDRITQELLDAVDHPDQLDAVVARHSRSKGPLYNALARATNTLKGQLPALGKKIKVAEDNHRKRQEQMDTLDREIAALRQRSVALAKQLADTESKLARNRETLDQVARLQKRGFGPGELTRLHDILGQMAASQGAKPEDGVSQFFETVSRYEHVVSLDLEAKRAEVRAKQAKADAKRWEAEARSAEAQSKARREAIQATERLLARGVKPEDLLQWGAILAAHGLTVKDVGTDLARYGSLTKTCRERDGLLRRLQADVEKTTNELVPLQREQTRVIQAIDTIRDNAVQVVQNVAVEVAKNMATMQAQSEKYGVLREKATKWAEEIKMAEPLAGMEPEDLGKSPPSTIRFLLAESMAWAKSESRNVDVEPPEYVRQGTYLNSYHKLPLVKILVWALAGVPSGDDHRALGTGT